MMINVTCHCPMCGTISEVTCDANLYDQYVTTSTPIQEIFPDMTLQERELLISGMCLACQGRFFVEDEEDDEDLCDGWCDECADFNCPFNEVCSQP